MEHLFNRFDALRSRAVQVVAKTNKLSPFWPSRARHDANGPLTAVLGYLEIIAKDQNQYSLGQPTYLTEDGLAECLSHLESSVGKLNSYTLKQETPHRMQPVSLRLFSKRLKQRLESFYRMTRRVRVAVHPSVFPASGHMDPRRISDAVQILVDRVIARQKKSFALGKDRKPVPVEIRMDGNHRLVRAQVPRRQFIHRSPTRKSATALPGRIRRWPFPGINRILAPHGGRMVYQSARGKKTAYVGFRIPIHKST